MAWVVDTCVLLDVRMSDPSFGRSSAACLLHYSATGLVLAPVSYVELAPQFRGVCSIQDSFLKAHQVATHDAWSPDDTLAAHSLWADFTALRRTQKLPRRPVADALIAAFAMRFQGIITRNVADFRAIAPSLPIVDATIAIQKP